MKKSVLTLSIVAMLSIPFAAQASLLLGVLNFTGEANISSSVAEPGSIVFTSNLFLIEPSSGDFAALAGTAGVIQPIQNPPDATGVALDPTIPPFMTFNVLPNISIQITELLPGIDPQTDCDNPTALAGQVCTPDEAAAGAAASLAPYNLQNTSPTTSSASFNFIGIETDSSTSTSIGVVGSFSDPSVDMSYQAILGLIEGGGTFITPFSAQISTTPEPATLTELMMGFGLVGIGLVYRKKLKRA